MHTANNTLWCVLLLLIELTKALNYADFGLPNNNPCIFTFEQTVYIINEQSLSIRFNQPWDIITPQIIKHNLTTVASCRITSSGKLILIPSSLQQPLQVIDDITNSWNFNNNITYFGSQNAIDTFINRNTFISHFTTTTFNDFIMIFGGNQSSTFILDTRYSTTYSWFEVPFQTTTPPSSPDSVLYATSRWVLHFRIEINIVYIDCFDSITFQWYGTISSIELNNNSSFPKNIQAIPLINNSSDSDSLLIIAVQQENNQTTTELWKLDISTWIPDRLTLIKLNPLIQQPNTFSGDGGGSVVVTPIDDEIAFFYGGIEQMTFLNTRNFSFVSPQWLITQDPIVTTDEVEESNHTLAIVLGSVLGGIFFIVVIIILFIWFYKRKRNSVPLRPNNNNNEKPSMLQKNKWPLLSKRGVEKEDTNSPFRESPPLSEFTLSPIKRLSPIKMFSASDTATSSSAAVQEEIIVLPQEEEQQQQMIKKSRFREHFDFHSYPPTHLPDTIVPSHSLPLGTSTTTKNNQPQQLIPRSSSS